MKIIFFLHLLLVPICSEMFSENIFVHLHPSNTVTGKGIEYSDTMKCIIYGQLYTAEQDLFLKAVLEIWLVEHSRSVVYLFEYW